jgi:hypothetical protein
MRLLIRIPARKLALLGYNIFLRVARCGPSCARVLLELTNTLVDAARSKNSQRLGIQIRRIPLTEPGFRILANSSRSPVFPQKIVSEVHYCELLFLELSKSREKSEILSSYNFKN